MAAPSGSTPGRSLGERLQDAAFWSDVRERARRQILPLLVVAIVAFMDYQLHAQAGAALIVALVGGGIVLFFREALALLGQKLNLTAASGWVSMLFVSVPIAFYFFVRGKGTLSDGDGVLIGVVIAGLPLAFNWLAPRADPALRGYYQVRDRLVPAVLRPVALVVLSLVLTFGVVHGQLGDVRILFGETASKAAFPDPDRILMTAILNVVLAFALLHSPSAEPAA